MTVHFVDPRAATTVEVEPYDLAVPPGHAHVVVGVLANGFPDSERFAKHVAEALRADTAGEWTARLYNKHDASAVAGDQLLDGIAAECHAAVTLYGH
jgi:hypothetical protein